MMKGLAGQAQAAFERGDHEKATSLLKRLSKEQPNNPLVFFQLGNAQAALGEHESAVRSFGRVLRLKPDLAAAHFNKANSHFAIGEHEQALRAYERSVRDKPIPIALRRLGYLHLEAGRPGQARASLQQALAETPNDAEALILMSRALHALDELEAERSHLAEALRNWPDDVAVQNEVAARYVELEWHDEALTTFQNLERIRPTAESAYNVGYAHVCLEQWAQAADAYQRAIDLRPDYHKAHHELGNVLRRLKQLDQAHHVLLHAIELAPDAWESHCYLGEVLADMGDRDAAAEEYKVAIRMFRDTETASGKITDDAYFRLWQLQSHRDSEERSVTLTEWLAYSPENPIARHLSHAARGAVEVDRAPDDYVRAEFDGFAATFDQVLAKLEYRAPNLVAEAVAGVVGNVKRRVLDCGCGTGLCGPLLAPFSARIDGIDLSAKMLDQARRLDVYDELVAAELTQYMSERPNAYDLVVSADTLVYFGDLRPPITAAAVTLCSDGYLAFTVERLADDVSTDSGYVLNDTGRYGHHRSYVHQRLSEAGFAVCSLEEVTLRQQGGRPVLGYLVLARRS